MIRRGFLKLLCAGNAGVLAASISRAPLELLGLEEVSEPETIPDSPIIMPGVGLQGYIKSVRLDHDPGNMKIEFAGEPFEMPGLASVTMSFDLLLTPPVMYDDSLRKMLNGGYVHILAAKPPNKVGA